MAAVGVMLIIFGGMTVWAGLHKTVVFDLFRGFLGAAPTARTATGAPS